MIKLNTGCPSKKFSNAFFVVTSARNALSTLLLDIFETKIRVYDKISDTGLLHFWNYGPERKTSKFSNILHFILQISC